MLAKKLSSTFTEKDDTGAANKTGTGTSRKKRKNTVDHNRAKKKSNPDKNSGGKKLKEMQNGSILTDDSRKIFGIIN